MCPPLMYSANAPFKVFSGTASRYMAEEICRDLGVELGQMKVDHFADGEFEVVFEETIRGFREILDGKMDDVPESYFLNAGTIDEVRARVK